MDNKTTINGIEITATFRDGSVELSFAKAGQVIKVCDSSEMVRFVRPESRQQVAKIIESAKSSDEANAYWTARKAEIEADEAEYQERTGHYAKYQHGHTPTCSDTMRKAMAVQG